MVPNWPDCVPAEVATANPLFQLTCRRSPNKWVSGTIIKKVCMETIIEWAYLIQILPDDVFEQQSILNKFGKEGWELVSVASANRYFSNYVAYLKRMKLK